tara:strand:- start:28735 stop:29016 length:282 start_codon:yes stop_codon:yes gene_type:complete
MNWIVVPTISKKGSPLDSHIINLDNVLYFREWFQGTPITEENPGKTVAYVIGGKEIIIEMPLHKINELIYNKGSEIRYTEMLPGVKKRDKAKA